LNRAPPPRCHKQAIGIVLAGPSEASQAQIEPALQRDPAHGVGALADRMRMHKSARSGPEVRAQLPQRMAAPSTLDRLTGMGTLRIGESVRTRSD